MEKKATRLNIDIFQLAIAMLGWLVPLVFPNIAGWNIPIFNRKYIFKGSILHCYVRLLECTLLQWIVQVLVKGGR